MRKFIFFICLISVSIHGWATSSENNALSDANIVGHVIDKKTGEHLPYITVGIKGTTIGTTTDATGHYFLKDVPEGYHVLEVSFIGYESIQKNIVVKNGQTQEVNFELEETPYALDEVVVSANRNDISRRLVPNLVNILDVKTFDRTNSTTIAEGLNFQPGVRVENNCQNCGFTQVRMNGLEGAYSQILIDSRPIFSSLSGVYGLEQIPANMIDRIEIIRGGGSALFGASAIAGTINIITKEPTYNSGQISHSITSIGGTNTFDNNTNLNASLISDDQKMGLMIFGQKRHRSAYDHDDDGFSEIPQLDAQTLGFRSFIKTGIYSKLVLEYHNMHEFRRGGDNLDKPPYEAYITEQIESNINGGSVKYEGSSRDAKHRYNIYSAAQLNNRKSYYGGGDPVSVSLVNGDTAAAEERLNSYGRTKGLTYNIGGQYAYSFDQLWFMPSQLTGGLEHTYDDLKDKMGFRDHIEQSVNINSAYVQNEWRNDKWSFLIGGRLDKHSMINHAIFSPRANVRYNPIPETNIRISYGQGFRAPQIYDEDLHVDIAGGQHIISVLDPNLKEEKSHSVSSSIDWYHLIGSTEVNILLEGFYTRLNNPFVSISEEQSDNSIIKTVTNASGAKVYGMNIEGRAEFGSLVQMQLGMTIQKSLYDDARRWSGDENDDVTPTKRMMRTPNVYGFFVATVYPVKNLSTALSGTYTGNMLVPHEAGVISKNRTEKSSPFFDLGWKVSYEIPFYKSSVFEINAGIKNIFNAYQKDFDQGPDRASSYIYGPALPRSYFAGGKISF